MKKILLGTTVCLSILASVSKAQNIQPCGMHSAMEYFKKNLPGYKEQLEANEIATNQLMAAKTSTTSMDTITIPVVFHVLHQNGPENISDNVLYTLMDNVNKDFARLGSDTATIDPLFKPLYINSFIRFTLAKKDPNGNCTNGIIHHYDENTNWAQANLLAYQYSTPAPGNWNPSKYLNIYIVKQIIDDGGSQGIIVGYTYKPGNAPVSSADAIVYRHDFLGDFVTTRSMSHEIGHWLGLSHTFGDSNEAGTGTCGDDNISDTPPTTGFFSTCPSVLTNTVCSSTRPNIQNIMDYSSCPRMFTQGQTNVMRTAALSAIASRATMTGTNNLVNTTGVCLQVSNGTGGFNYPLAPAPNCAPIADFASNKVFACSGQTVSFSSTSYNGSVTNYNWVFEGGTPATSTNSTEVVTYATPGAHSVSLTVSNGVGSSSKSKTQAVWVGWNSYEALIPFSEGFESGIPSDRWYVRNEDAGSPGFKSANYGSGTSLKSAVLENYGEYTPGQEDALESIQFDYTNVTNIAITFDYSYAETINTTDEYFRFQYSLDCGGTWNNMTSSPTEAVLATSGGTVNTGSYYPFVSTKWKTATMNDILAKLSNQRDVKFRFYYRNASSGQANNLYIDNINISGVVGLEDLARTIDLSIYPNPTATSSIVEFTSPVSSKVEVTVNDITGRLVEKSNFTTDGGVASKYEINKSQSLNSGIYFVTISLDGQKVTKKLIIE